MSREGIRLIPLTLGLGDVIGGQYDGRLNTIDQN
jgi:hypothetical protein